MSEKQIKQLFSILEPHFDEKNTRLLASAIAKVFGRGIKMKISNCGVVSRPTIDKGLIELEQKSVVADSIRKEGGGRKKISDKHPKLVEALESLIEPTIKGDPMSPLRWTCKSTRNLADELISQGYKIGHKAVSRILHELGYSLQTNRKDFEKTTFSERNKQFEYINKITKTYISQNEPVISVDTKKKELVGRYKNNGKEWRPKKNPQKVLMHDFLDPQLGVAIPYGVYDIGNNTGWVNIGKDHDTSMFAVESIRRWWYGMGEKNYKNKKKLLICADSGGSNGYRVKLWKTELQKFSNETGLEITVVHLPPGTSKWNKIEHRLFSHITMNWRGKPLVNYETIINLISNTKTRQGLAVKAQIDTGIYPTGIKVTKAELEELNIYHKKFLEKLNYTIKPVENKRGIIK